MLNYKNYLLAAILCVTFAFEAQAEDKPANDNTENQILTKADANCKETNQIIALEENIASATSAGNADKISELSSQLDVLRKAELECLSAAGFDISQLDELGNIIPAAGGLGNFARDVFAAPIVIENSRQISPTQP